MGIISRAKAKLGHFILDHLVTQHVIKEWKSGFIEDPLPQIPATPVSTERHTDSIDEQAVKAAIAAQGLKAVRGVALDVPADRVAPGKLIRWYQERKEIMSTQETIQMSAVQLQEELLKRLDEGGVQ
jgi:hypothetical protein